MSKKNTKISLVLVSFLLFGLAVKLAHAKENGIFDVIDFGAKGDGRTKNTVAINAAINKCSSEGGGHVVISMGDYLTGAIHMKSNVDLHIEANAILRFSTDPGDYLLTVSSHALGG